MLNTNTARQDTLTVFWAIYRRYQDTKTSCVRIEAINLDEAMWALTKHVGSTNYTLTSIDPEY